MPKQYKFIAYAGQSTDIKPPQAPMGAVYVEKDTAKTYIFNGAWYEIGAAGTAIGPHPGLSAHDTLGLATQNELDAHSHALLHSRLHSIVSALDHNGFPGGTTTYLRADSTWATPAGGSGTLVETHIPLIALAEAQAI